MNSVNFTDVELVKILQSPLPINTTFSPLVDLTATLPGLFPPLSLLRLLPAEPPVLLPVLNLALVIAVEGLEKLYQVSKMRDMYWKSWLSHLSAAPTGTKIAFFSLGSTVPTRAFANQGGIQSCRPINSVSCLAPSLTLCILGLHSILSLTWAIIVISFFGPGAFLDFLNLFSSLLSSMVQSLFHHVQKIRAARAPERRYFRMLV